ncbi:MAG: cytochrome C [Acidiferrobacter sp.]
MVFISLRSEPRKGIALFVAILGGLLMSSSAWALPSFARQTGWSCAACHTSFPQLTPMGRMFKLMGYTTTNLQPQQKVEANLGNTVGLLIPRISQFSIFLQASATRVAGGQAALGTTSVGGGTGSSSNNVEFPQQVSLFYAGEITPHVGDFLHLTYSGQDGSLAFDDSSIVRAQAWKLGAANTLITGVDVNNTPTSTDLWNTVPDWQSPFFVSDYAAATAVPATFIGSSPGAAFPMVGVGGYAADIFGANKANWVYLEADGYTNGSGIGTTAGTAGAFAQGGSVVKGGWLSGTAPYVRLAFQHDWADWNWEVGTYGMWSRVYATPLTRSAVNQFNDYDLDSQLQWLDINSNNNVTVRASWIHEDQSFAAGQGDSSLANGNLNTVNINATYWYHGRYGAQGGYEDTFGPANALFWGGYTAGNPYSANGSPDTSDEWVEASYLPWMNTRFSVRYTLYNKFRGLGGSTTGSTFSASKYNTLELLAWIAY